MAAFDTSNTTVFWGPNNLTSLLISEIEINFSKDSLPLGRGGGSLNQAAWKLDIGEVVVSTYIGGANLYIGPGTELGSKRLLRVVQNPTTTPFTWFRADCVYLGSDAVFRVNDTPRFRHRWKILDTISDESVFPPTRSSLFS